MQKRALESIDGGKKTFHEKDLPHILPKNLNQRACMEEYARGQNLNLVGSAGVGKTFLALYLALKDLLDRDTDITKLVVVRSAVPVRDIGFLPGTEEEKTEIYEAPYRAIFDELFEYSKAWENLKKSGRVRFMTTSYVRGITLKDTVVVVDETQSLNAHELDSIITRLGCNSRLILCGDGVQTDLTRSNDRKGFHNFNLIISALSEFSTIKFTEEDIVRSGLVKNYIIKRNQLGLEL